MDARRSILTVCASIVLLSLVSPTFAASARTRNFLVSAATPELAREVATAAENYRRDLAIEWLGQELAPWSDPCPITVQADPRLGAGGATSFSFTGNHPHGWTMSIQGSRERVLDSVLPHEITHTIFATHFGRPLPRWADEGACTTVEHESERTKQEQLLYQFLTTNRGIPFNRMYAMKEYPADILPLYSQGYALARFLIAQGGKRRFVDYVGEGMNTNHWTAATKKFYGYESLSDLQLSWLEWVRRGTPAINEPSDITYVSTDAAKSGKKLSEILQPDREPTTEPKGRPAPNSLAGVPARDLETIPLSRSPANRTLRDASPASFQAEVATNDAPSDGLSTADGWYARRRDRAVTAARLSREGERLPANIDLTSDIPTADARCEGPACSLPADPKRSTILEWSRNNSPAPPASKWR